MTMAGERRTGRSGRGVLVEANAAFAKNAQALKRDGGSLDQMTDDRLREPPRGSRA
jgi:hypothetical protein